MKRKIDFGTVLIVVFIVAAGILFCWDRQSPPDEDIFLASDETESGVDSGGTAGDETRGTDVSEGEDSDFEASESSTTDEIAVDAESVADTENAADTKIYVYVCGQVKSPGVYELPAGSRLYEAVEAAGGAGEDARLERLNLADILADGQKVYVPTEDEELPEADSDADGAVTEDKTSDGRVNINTADVQELLTLPGIGETRAKAIVAYREANGPFDTVEDLKSVTGIGDGVYGQVQALIRVD